MNVSSISVIIPVYQSAERLSEHVECLRLLRPNVHEFIWVITKSPDNSHQLAREAAREIGGQVFEVPRGLYQAWNLGIAHATGDLIYISTTGDTITPEALNALAFCIEKNQADVVFSPPAIFPATKSNLKRCRHWPVFKFAPIMNRYAGGRLPKEKAALIQVLSGASGLLGSCASCLFRASFLKDRPFPTEFHHYGDTAWTYKNLSENTLAFYPKQVARFMVHDQCTNRVVNKRQVYRLTESMGNELPLHLATIVFEYTRASAQIDKIRDSRPKFGWWWLPEAWQARGRRNAMKRALIKALERF